MFTPHAWIILWDFPMGTRGLSTFYRRLDDLLRGQGGSAFCRSTKSAYIVSGNGAQELAYAIAKLAERFGAGRVGAAEYSGAAAPGGVGGGADSLRGTVVLPLGDLPPDHFEQLTAAERVIDAVCIDRRKLARKRPGDARMLDPLDGE